MQRGRNQPRQQSVQPSSQHLPRLPTLSTIKRARDLLDTDGSRLATEIRLMTFILTDGLAARDADPTKSTTRLVADVFHDIRAAQPRTNYDKLLENLLKSPYTSTWFSFHSRAPPDPKKPKAKLVSLPFFKCHIQISRYDFDPALFSEVYSRAVVAPQARQASHASHLLIIGRPYLIPRPTTLIPMDRARSDIIASHVQHVLSSFAISPTDIDRRTQFLEYMIAFLTSPRGIPGASLIPFGSSANGLFAPDSDMDLCLSTPAIEALDERIRLGLSQPEEGKAARKKLIHRLRALFQSSGFTNLQPITHSHVPIIKGSHPHWNMDFDVCFGKSISEVNTDLFREYTLIDARVKPLLLLVKGWAKVRGISEASLGTINSYTHCLILFYYLQRRGVIPPIQRLCCTDGPLPYLDASSPEEVDGICLCCRKPLPVDERYGRQSHFLHGLRHTTFPNETPVHILLQGFFHFCAFEFDWERNTISPRLAQAIPRSSKVWRLPQGRMPFCVEDPFILEKNTAATASSLGGQLIRYEWERAYRALDEGKGLADVFSPWVPVTANEAVLLGVVRPLYS